MERRGFIGRVLGGVAAGVCGLCFGKTGTPAKPPQSIATDEWIRSSQMQLLRNSVRPRWARGQITLTAEERRSLVNAVKLHYQGWEKVS